MRHATATRKVRYMATAMICPKCDAPMREIRRSGVLIERCVSCGGVFLDPGELEHLIEGERTYYEQEQPRSQRGFAGDDDYHDEYEDDDRRGSGKRRKSRKRSFFEELLDFDLD